MALFGKHYTGQASDAEVFGMLMLFLAGWGLCELLTPLFHTVVVWATETAKVFLMILN
jgi:hypothetical protein